MDSTHLLKKGFNSAYKARPNYICYIHTKANLERPKIQNEQFSCVRLCNPMDRSTPGFPVHHQLPKFPPTHVHRVSVAIQPSHPLSSPSPRTMNLAQHQGSFQMSSFFPSGSQSIGVSFEHQSFHEYSGLISFRMDWLDLLAVQGTLKSLL